MPEASPRPSPDALPSKVSLAWKGQLLDVRHLSPGASWQLDDVRVEATREGTRVVAGDEVLLAAGAGERATRSLGALSVTLEPTLAPERIPGDARELDVRFFKIVSISVLAFVALVAAFLVTPDAGYADGDVFSGPPMKLSLVLPPEKTIEKRPAFDEVPTKAPKDAVLLAPSKPTDPQKKPAADAQRVNRLMASLFGGAFDRMVQGGLGNGVNDALDKLQGPGVGAADLDGLGALNSRGNGGGGPAGAGLSIGRIGPGRPTGSPAGFGLNPSRKQLVTPGDGPKELLGNGLERDVVMAVIRRHQSEITFCYESALTQNPALAGKVAVSFTIDGSGSISEAQIAESGLNNENVEACMLSRIRRWKFPEPKGGGVVVITFPWVFHVAGTADE
ncbi:MAG: AgmX/PglI C-terminal domain-containing protein [Myxococcaceae bacterium]|nr:AgmX/PglI C-terminal domain-containing protein [Myxococcaceae bacterium]